MRRQGPALVVAVVLLAASVVWTLRLEWLPYLDRQPRDVTTVAAGESGAYAGSTYTVTETRRFAGADPRGEELEVAADATLVVVSLDVEPGQDAGLCTTRAVAGDTRWDTAGFSDSDWSVPDRFESYCDPEATEPYALQLTFVVPSGAADDVRLEISDLSLRPAVLQLELDA